MGNNRFAVVWTPCLVPLMLAFFAETAPAQTRYSPPQPQLGYPRQQFSNPRQQTGNPRQQIGYPRYRQDDPFGEQQSPADNPSNQNPSEQNPSGKNQSQNDDPFGENQTPTDDPFQDPVQDPFQDPVPDNSEIDPFADPPAQEPGMQQNQPPQLPAGSDPLGEDQIDPRQPQPRQPLPRQPQTDPVNPPRADPKTSPRENPPGGLEFPPGFDPPQPTQPRSTEPPADLTLPDAGQQQPPYQRFEDQQFDWETQPPSTNQSPDYAPAYEPSYPIDPPPKNTPYYPPPTMQQPNYAPYSAAPGNYGQNYPTPADPNPGYYDQGYPHQPYNNQGYPTPAYSNPSCGCDQSQSYFDAGYGSANNQFSYGGVAGCDMLAEQSDCQDCGFDCGLPMFYISGFGGSVSLQDLVSRNNDRILTDDGPGFGVALGQRHGHNLRSELEFSYRQSDVIGIQTNNVTLPVTGELISYSGMANAYWEFMCFPQPCFKPYVGAGVGFVSLDAELFAANGQSVIPPNLDNDTSFAYQFIGGINYKAYRNMDLFVEYRYYAADSLQIDTLPGFGSGRYDYQADNWFAGIRWKF